MGETFRERELTAPNKTELFCGLGCWAVYLVGMGLLARWLLPLLGVDLHSEKGWSLAQVIILTADFVVVAAVFCRFLWRSFAPLKGNVKRLLLTVLYGFAAYWVLMCLVSAIVTSVSLGMDVTPDSSNNAAIRTALTNYRVPMAICTVLLAPVTEECLVRGALFAPLCRRKPWLAYVVTSVLFSLLHIVQHYEAGQALLPYFLTFLEYLPAGLVLGWAYQRTRSVWGPIALHCVINLLAVVSTV